MDQQPGSTSGGSLFGKVNMAQSTQAPVFGASVEKSAFGSESFGNMSQSAASNTFGKFSDQSPSGFVAGSNSSNQTASPRQGSSSLFGAPKPSSFGTPSFGGLSNQTSTKAATFNNVSIPNVFGGQPLFGSSKTNSSSLLGSNARSGGNTLFGTHGSTLTTTSSGIGSSSVFGNKSSTAGLFGTKPVTPSENPFAPSSSATATSSSIVFGSSQTSFVGTGASQSSQALSLGVEDSDGSFRKRSSSGTMGSSVLFGKKQAARAATGSSSGSASSSEQKSGHTFKMSSQESHSNPGGEKKLFGKETSSNDSSTNQGLFRAKPPSYSESGKMFTNASKSRLFSGNSTSFKPGSSNVSEVPAFKAAPSALFGKAVNSLSGSSVASSSSGGSQSLFPVASPSKLFGKVDSSSKKLFGGISQTTDRAISNKDQSSSSGLFNVGPAESRKLFQGKKASESSHSIPSSNKLPFQPEQGEISKVASPSKRSLSKWNRNRDPLVMAEKKRTGEEVDQREPKRVRGNESQADVKRSPSSVISRPRISSLRASVDDQSLNASIIVKNIPVHMNKGPVLREHFSRFGDIKRLQPMPTKNAANISFHTHEAAKAAKDKGKHLKGGKSLSIFWRNLPVKSPGSTLTSPEIRSSEDKMKQAKSKFELQSDIQDELNSMAGTFDHQEDISPKKFRQRDNLQKPAFQKPPVASILSRQTQERSADRRSPTPPRKPPVDLEKQDVAELEIAKKLLKVMWKAKPRDATEAVAVLDARDKLLRMLQKRQSDLTSATAFAGTCEDMCSEKERYYREDIRRLALYEVIPSTMTSLTGLKSKVDHTRAVKEYSRSSADQEEPLPHELRPLPVLMTTMNYLLSEIADQGGEGKWSEWYDFLWNRTRGIRKDITQQQLCEVQVAELLEKCTRFHIFCSARLCEEDMMSFDAKINNENLTKCLQTVKELYADLEKRKVFCQNEAEFRAYMALMNLNEGDTLREVQQLRPEIRGSAHIHFALQAYHALNSSNYVRFFRLIKDATFLNACILHRYFNQIRGQALRIIMKAHRATGKNRVMYPVSELIRLLGFEDGEQVENFCDHYCLTVEGDEIVMDAQAFLEPESSIPETRSPTLVEAKRSVSVGEIINGCLLPPLQLPTPFSSFDSSGTFVIPAAIQEALVKGHIGNKPMPVQHSQDQMPGIDDRQQQQEAQVSEFKPGLPNAMEVQRGRTLFSNDAIKSVVRSLILEELDKEMRQIASQVVKEENHQTSLVLEAVKDMASATVQEMARELAEETIKEEEARMRQQLAQEMAAQRHRVFTALSEDVVEDIVLEIATSVAHEEMILVNRELHHQRMERCGQGLRDDMLITAVDAMILDVAQDVFEVDVLAKRERLAATEDCVLNLRCRRFFQTWQRKYAARIRVKRAMLDFPSTVPNRSPREQMQRLVPDRPDTHLSKNSFFINSRAKLTVQSPMEVIQQQLYLSTRLSMASARSMLTSMVLWRPLDLSHTVTPQLCNAFGEWIEEGLIEPDTALLQWKLCVSVPKKEANTTELEANFVKWIRAKLCWDSHRDDLLETIPSFEGEVLSLYHVNANSKNRRSVSLGVCIQAFHGRWTEDQEIAALNKSILKGMSALLFICSSAEDLSIVDSSAKASIWKNERKRLHQMLKQKPKTPRIPLVLIVPRLTGESQLSTTELDSELHLSELRKSGHLSVVHVSHIYIGAQDHPTEYFSDWSSQLSNSLRFAATHIPAPPKLWVKPVSAYVEAVVIEFYKAPVYQDLRTRTRLQMLHQSPNILVSLYNEVIEHLALICASDDLRNMSWPAPEFDKSTLAKQGPYPTSQWNTDAHLCDLYDLVTKMRLPCFHYSDMETDDWATACRDVWAFLNKITKKDSGPAKINLFQQTAQLLIRTKKSFDQLCWLTSEDGPCEPNYTNMTWTDLIDACIQYKLLSLRSGHLDIRKPDRDDDEERDDKVEDFEEVLVYYPEDELSDFEPPASWTEALRDTETSERGQLKPAVKLAVTKRDQTLLEQSTTKANVDTHEEDTVTSQVDEADNDWAVLKHRFEQERMASKSLESRLASAISPVSDYTAESWAPENFGAYVSPILAANKETGSERISRKDRSIWSSSFHQSSHPETNMHATPRRPIVKNCRPDSTSTRKIQDCTTDSVNNVNRGFADPDTTDSQLHWAESSMSEKVMSIQERVEAQKQEDLLFEMRLRQLMDSTPLL